MILKIKTDTELYVYMNGKLLYKRWLKQGHGMVFCPTFGNFRASDVKPQKQTNGRL